MITPPNPRRGAIRCGISAVRVLSFASVSILSFKLPGYSQATKPASDVIDLPAFTVSTDQDVGYRAGNSVSATRIDTAIKDLPFSISAFTEQFISDIGAQDLNDIVLFAPGVTSGDKAFVAGNNRYSIRGFDGDVPPQRNGFIGNRNVDSANVTRVEVVKGPASLLYGQIVPGGTVNYITKRPMPKRFVSFKASVGSDSDYRTVLDINQPLNSRIGTRVVAAYENGSQWAETGESKSWLFAPSATLQVTKNLSLTLDYEKTHKEETPLLGMMPNTQITGFSSAPTAANFPNVSARSRAQGLFDVGALNLGFLAATPLYREFNYVNNADYRKSDYETFNIELNAKLGEHWRARANYNWNDKEIFNKLTGLAQWDVLPTAAYRSTGLSLFDYLNEYQANPAGVLADSTKTQSVTLSRRKRLQVSTGSSNTYQAEASGKYEFGGTKLSPLLGAYRQYGVSSGYTATAPTAQFFAAWNYFDRSTWDKTGDYDEMALPRDSAGGSTHSLETAYYGVLTATLFHDRVIAVGGARYDKFQSGSATAFTYEATKTTPQFGVGFHVTKDALLFASYSNSFLIDSTSLMRPNPNYDPTKNLNTSTNPNAIRVPAAPTTGKGYELGLKTDFLSGRVSSTLSLFHLERANRVLNIRQNVAGLSTTGTPSSQEITFNSQGTVDQSEGVEFEITYSPLNNWQIYATAALMNIETTELDAPALRATTDPLVSGDYAAYSSGYAQAVSLIKGAVPEGSAEKLASLWTRYTFKEGALKNLWIAGGGTYTSAKAQRTANPTLFFDPYVLLDAAVGYDFKHEGVAWGVTLNVKNVADKEYYPANQSRGRPRQFTLSASTKF